MIQIPQTALTIKSNSKHSALQILQYAVLILIILYFGKALFIPLSFSLLISFILYPVCKWMENKGTNRGVAIAISIFTISVFMMALIYLFFSQLMEFANEWQSLKTKLSDTTNQISLFFTERFGWSIEKQSAYIKNSIGNSGTQVISFMRNTALSFTASIFFLLLIPIFSALILYHRTMMVNALYRILSPAKREIIHEILVETTRSYYNFIKGMLIVYFIVGILNSIGLAIIGVPHPFLFGFIASVLTFIPYIGIIIASLVPIAVSWITYNSIWYPLGVILIFSIVQVLEANIIFPLAVSSRLNVNTLAVLMVIIAGGIIWGAAGMILFIPFLGILKLIADRTEGLETLAMILGNGSQVKK